MITVQETTVWDTDLKTPNHKYILQDSGHICYGYIKHGEKYPHMFTRPSQIDWSRRSYKVLLRTKDADPSEKSWEVVGSRGDIYKVVLRDGKYTCTCPAATFRHRECKHIQNNKEGSADAQQA
jgi:hypothetical protein